jgi:DNA-binding phage protein
VTISQKTSLLSEIEAGAPIPEEKRAYFQARLKHRLYDYVVTKFQEKAETEGLTKAELARRIGRKPEVITRLLSSPGNWRLETVSDLLLGIAAEELDMKSTSLLNRKPRSSSRAA